jgi:hypothetical protein
MRTRGECAFLRLHVECVVHIHITLSIFYILQVYTGGTRLQPPPAL